MIWDIVLGSWYRIEDDHTGGYLLVCNYLGNGSSGCNR
jgi:hypothetical protein